MKNNKSQKTAIQKLTRSGQRTVSLRLAPELLELVRVSNVNISEVTRKALAREVLKFIRG